MSSPAQKRQARRRLDLIYYIIHAMRAGMRSPDDPFARSLLARPAWARMAWVAVGLAMLWGAILWAVAVP